MISNPTPRVRYLQHSLLDGTNFMNAGMNWIADEGYGTGIDVCFVRRSIPGDGRANGDYTSC